MYKRVKRRRLCSITKHILRIIQTRGMCFGLQNSWRSFQTSESSNPSSGDTCWGFQKRPIVSPKDGHSISPLLACQLLVTWLYFMPERMTEDMPDRTACAHRRSATLCSNRALLIAWHRPNRHVTNARCVANSLWFGSRR